MQWKLLLCDQETLDRGSPDHAVVTGVLSRNRLGLELTHLTGNRAQMGGASERFPYTSPASASTGLVTGTLTVSADSTWAMAAIPALAPAGESHLLGSTSVVQRITWGPDRITYRTYGVESTEVLRVAFQPGWIAAGGQVLHREPSLDGPGYTLQSIGDGSFVLHVHHVHSHNVVVTTDTPACGSGPWSAWLLCLSAPS